MTKILDDQSNEEEKEEENKVFELVLVDIKNTCICDNIKCIKKNMYDSDLKYVAISYRWGEMEEQYVRTPDYTAHITSFHLVRLLGLCFFINFEPDLKEIPYLWIDAISVDQHHHSKKKETILKMSEIYKNASYILAVPDLHWDHLYKNTANQEILDLIQKYQDIIHEDIKHSATNSINTANSSVIQKLKNKIKGVNEEELKKAYNFLAYLVHDWSNRTWVVSEYQIAKEKYIQYGTPLKYIFLALLWNNELSVTKPSLSYNFIDQHSSINPSTSNTTIFYKNVDNGDKFNNYLNSVFIQRSHIDMILNSMASRSEDRFYAILPSWNKYNHLIKNKNTISNWNITNMISVRLKLYDIIYDNDDLWDKARLLYMCSIHIGKPILPSFATFNNSYFTLDEIDDIDHVHKLAKYYLSTIKEVEKYIKDPHKMEFKSILKQNLIDIQYNQQQYSLSIKSDKYFIFNQPPKLSQEEISYYSLEDNNKLRLIFIPYFTYNIPGYSHLFPITINSIPYLSGTLILGNMDINRWVLHELHGCKTYGEPSLIPANDYIFNIY